MKRSGTIITVADYIQMPFKLIQDCMLWEEEIGIQERRAL